MRAFTTLGRDPLERRTEDVIGPVKRRRRHQSPPQIFQNWDNMHRGVQKAEVNESYWDG
jgi:hypothetical protein